MRVIPSNYKKPEEIATPVAKDTFIQPQEEESTDTVEEPTCSDDCMASPVDDPVKPNHYNEETSLACIDAMKITFGHSWTMHFCAITAFKYIWRYKNKNGIEDLKKANWYLDWYYANARERYEDENNQVEELAFTLIDALAEYGLDAQWPMLEAASKEQKEDEKEILKQIYKEQNKICEAHIDEE